MSLGTAFYRERPPSQWTAVSRSCLGVLERGGTSEPLAFAGALKYSFAVECEMPELGGEKAASRNG